MHPPAPDIAPPAHFSPHADFGRDGEHLRLLAIFHYVYGGVVMAFSCMFIIHIALGVASLNNPSLFTQPGGAMGGAPPPAPPAWFGWVFIGMGSTLLVLGWTIGLLTIFSGRCIAKRRRRVFSLIIAGINCLSVPLGTTLGVFTFIILMRDPVRVAYGEKPKSRIPAPGGFPVQGYH